MIYVFTIISIVLFIYSFTRDKRNLVNAFLFLISIAMIYLSIISLAYEKLPKVHIFLLDVLYKMLPISILIFAILMIINGFVVLKKEGKSLSNTLPILFGIGILMYAIIFKLYSDNIYKHISSYWMISIFANLFTLISALFALFMFVFFALLTYSILYLYLPKKKDYDFIIIHGSGLIDGYKVPPLLAARIDKAIEAYQLREIQDAKIIASGGQGSDEKVSEAKAITDYLLDKGIDRDSIIIEDKSTTTYENLKFSKEVAEKIKENPNFLFISNNYHVFRTTIYARRLNMNGNGVGAKTAGYYIPSAFIREYIAILFRLKKVIIGIVVAFIIFLILTNLPIQ
ncbi:MAG: YdcF family protein [Tissierellia bacterium]|nr:YdcF family protein [Tissierellia bacterium]